MPPLHIAVALAPFLAAYALQGAKTPAPLAVVFLIALVSFRILRRQPVRREVPFALFLPWIAFLGWCALTTVSLPPLDRHLFVLGKMVLMLLFGLAMFQAEHSTRRAFGVATVALAWIESVLFWIFTSRIGWNSVVLSGNSAYAGMLIGAGLLFLASESAVPGSRSRQAALLVCAAILSAGLFGLRSKSAILGTAAGLLVLPCRAGAWRVGVVTLCVGALSLLHVSPENLAFSLQDLPGRLVIWKTAVAAAADRWLFGFGLGNFEEAYLLHQRPEPQLIRFGKTSPFAHNDALQLAVTAGLPALALAAWAIVAALRRPPAAGERGAVENWAAAVVVLTIVVGLFNFSVYLPFNALQFAGALGILAAHSAREGERSINVSSAVFNVGAVTAVFMVFFGLSWTIQNLGRPETAARLMPIRSGAWYESALAVQREGDPLRGMERAIPYLERSVFWNRGDAFAWSRLARTLAVTRRGDDAPARAAFERARTLAPFHATFWIEEGFFELDRGSAEQAERLFARAAELEPHTPLPKFALAAARFRLGRRAEALDAGHAALKMLPLAAQLSDRSEYTRFLFRVRRDQIAALLEKIGRMKETPRPPAPPAPVRI